MHISLFYPKIHSVVEESVKKVRYILYGTEKTKQHAQAYQETYHSESCYL